MLRNNHFKSTYETNAFLTFQTKQMIFKRYYSYSNSDSEPLSELTPISILTLGGLNSKDTIKSYRDNKKNKGGIYSFKNTVNGKQYIGSAKDFYLRFIEHIENKKSNSALQAVIIKYGMEKFNFVIYEYFTFESKNLSNKALTVIRF